MLATVALLGTGSSLHAQTASQITPPSFRPPLERGGGFSIPSTAGLEAPAGADKLVVWLGGVKVEGARPELADATQALSTRLTGKTITAAEIFVAARELEAAYARAGYVLVRIVLPPQQVVNGANLRLIVIDGFIERVDTDSLPERVRARIAAMTNALVGRRGLTLREIERQLLLAGDTAGVVMRSTLTAGKAPGATVLRLEARHQSVTGLLTVDNTTSVALGRWSVGTGVDFNSVAGFGEVLYLRANGYPGTKGDDGFFDKRPRNRALAAGAILPIGLDGLTFNVEATDARTTPLATAGIQTASEFERISVRLRYALIRSRDLNLTTELAFDAQEEKLLLDVAGVFTPLSLDRLRVFRLNAEGNFIAPWGGLFAGRVTPSFGVSGLGARTADEATPILPLSRQGADADFQKLEGFVSYAQTLVEHLAVDIRARAQTSFNAPLLRSEQFGIANAAGLSSFDSGSLQGDSGYVVRGEVQSPWVLPMFDVSVVVAPYLFAAAGAVNLEEPTAVEQETIHARSAGAGVRFGAGKPGMLTNATVTLEYGRQWRDDAVAEEDRFTLIGAVQF